MFRTVSVGSVAPDIKEPGTDGKTIMLKSYRGKYVLVDFWASWCGPCREKNPGLIVSYQKFKNKNFTILGISLDKNKNSWMAAIKKDVLPWPQASFLHQWESPAATAYGVHAIPQNFLVDADGRIIAKNLFGKTLDDKLTQLLN